MTFCVTHNCVTSLQYSNETKLNFPLVPLCFNAMAHWFGGVCYSFIGGKLDIGNKSIFHVVVKMRKAIDDILRG